VFPSFTLFLLCTIVIDIRAPVNAAPFRLPSNGTAGGLPVSVSWDSAHEGTIAFGRAEQKRSSSSLSSSTGISAAPFGASGLLMHGHRHRVLHWPTFSLASQKRHLILNMNARGGSLLVIIALYFAGCTFCLVY
jgi:hypothetical protein